MQVGEGGSAALDAVVGVDREARLRAFCEAEYAGLARYCLWLTGDEQLARDITQEAFVRLFGRWLRVREPRPYLYLVATNLARRHWRRARYERDALALTHLRDEHTPPPDLGVRDVVDRLPRKWRDPVLLHYYADLPVAEVAAYLGEPVGTVKRRLGEARDLLARSLGGGR